MKLFIRKISEPSIKDDVVALVNEDGEILPNQINASVVFDVENPIEMTVKFCDLKWFEEE